VHNHIICIFFELVADIISSAARGPVTPVLSIPCCKTNPTFMFILAHTLY